MYPARQSRAITIATNITLQLDGKYKFINWKIPVHDFLGTRRKELCSRIVSVACRQDQDRITSAKSFG